MDIIIYRQSKDIINAGWWVIRMAVIIYASLWFAYSYVGSVGKIDKIHDVITSDCSYGVKK